MTDLILTVITDNSNGECAKRIRRPILNRHAGMTTIALLNKPWNFLKKENPRLFHFTVKRPNKRPVKCPNGKWPSIQIKNGQVYK